MNATKGQISSMINLEYRNGRKFCMDIPNGLRALKTNDKYAIKAPEAIAITVTRKTEAYVILRHRLKKYLLKEKERKLFAKKKNNLPGFIKKEIKLG